MCRKTCCGCRKVDIFIVLNTGIYLVIHQFLESSPSTIEIFKVSKDEKYILIIIKSYSRLTGPSCFWYYIPSFKYERKITKKYSQWIENFHSTEKYFKNVLQFPEFGESTIISKGGTSGKAACIYFWRVTEISCERTISFMILNRSIVYS